MLKVGEYAILRHKKITAPILLGTVKEGVCMLSKIEKTILKECSKSKDGVQLLTVYENLRKKPNYTEYNSAIHSLKEKGYFDEYSEIMNETYVTLSTKGFNYKFTEFINSVKEILKSVILPIIIGVVSSIITSYFLQ